MHKKTILENIDKIHTTEMGIVRIRKNLEINEDPVNYCILKIHDDDAIITKGKKLLY